MKEDLQKKAIQKSTIRLSINAFVMGDLLLILMLIWMQRTEHFNLFMIAEIAFAIPLLMISIICYGKLGYRDEYTIYDKIGWVAMTTANNFALNIVGIILAGFSTTIAIVYFIVLLGFAIGYYILNIYYKRYSVREELTKLVFILLILFFGGIFPIFFLH